MGRCASETCSCSFPGDFCWRCGWLDAESASSSAWRSPCVAGRFLSCTRSKYFSCSPRHRTTSFIDLVTNSFGATVGAFAGWPWARLVWPVVSVRAPPVDRRAPALDMCSVDGASSLLARPFAVRFKPAPARREGGRSAAQLVPFGVPSPVWHGPRSLCTGRPSYSPGRSPAVCSAWPGRNSGLARPGPSAGRWRFFGHLEPHNRDLPARDPGTRRRCHVGRAGSVGVDRQAHHCHAIPRPRSSAG